MLLRHIFVVNFFDDDHPKIVETVARFPEMLVDRDRIFSFHVVTMFVYTTISLLRLQFSDILSHICRTSVAPRQVNGIFRAASGFLSDVELFPTGFVGKYVRIYDMGAAFGICPSSAWGTPSFRWSFFSSDDFVIFYPGLTQDISQISVTFVTKSRLFREFSALVFVDLKDLPLFFQDLLDVRKSVVVRDHEWDSGVCFLRLVRSE